MHRATAPASVAPRRARGASSVCGVDVEEEVPRRVGRPVHRLAHAEAARRCCWHTYRHRTSPPPPAPSRSLRLIGRSVTEQDAGVVGGNRALQRLDMHDPPVRDSRRRRKRPRDGGAQIADAPVTITVRPVHSACIQLHRSTILIAAIVARFVCRRRPSCLSRTSALRSSPATEQTAYGFSLKRPFA